MAKNSMSLTIVCGSLCAVNCLQPSQTQSIIAVAHNSLGVVELQLDRTGVDDSVFELRGLDANQDVLASVMLHIGTIADLPTLPGIPGYFGSEIVLTSGDAQQRSISRETRLIPIHANDPSTQAFLELGEVS